MIGTLSSEVAPISMSSGVSSAAAPRTAGSSACASSTDLTARVHLAGAESACGIDGAHLPGQSPATSRRRADHELAPQPVRPLDVDDHPARACSPASSRAQRCSVTASLNVLLSSSSLVTAVTMSIRRVMA